MCSKRARPYLKLRGACEPANRQLCGRFSATMGRLAESAALGGTEARLARKPAVNEGEHSGREISRARIRGSILSNLARRTPPLGGGLRHAFSGIFGYLAFSLSAALDIAQRFQSSLGPVLLPAEELGQGARRIGEAVNMFATSTAKSGWPSETPPKMTPS